MITLNHDEHVVLAARRHWWVLTEKLIAVIFLFLLPVILYFFWIFFQIQFPLLEMGPNEAIGPLLIFITSLYYLFLWLYFCIVFVDYYLDIWVVTNMRILDIEQHSLFHREVSECYLSKIQDVTVEIKGIMPTFLNYGDLHIQTAAEKREFMFAEVEDPNNIKNVILDQYNKTMASFKDNSPLNR